MAVVSKADHHGGGASRVAGELAELLNRGGHRADHWMAWAGDGFGEHRRPLYGRFQRWFSRGHAYTKRFGFPELIPFELTTFLRRRRLLDYDLFHFHDLSSAISPWTLRAISWARPVVWTFHDCSPFTGGCLYPMGCERFTRRCGPCPQLGEWPLDTNRDFTGVMQGIKRNLARSCRVIAVTPSNWMADMALGSGLFPSRPMVVPNGVDTTLFSPMDKPALRDELGMPRERRVVLLSAGSILDERKGTRHALQALRQIAELRPFLLVTGHMDDQARDMMRGFDYHEAGYVSDKSRLARYYASADLFLFCSLADNQPLVVLETLATGTPTVGFATGGIPDVVKQNETGYLVPQGDEAALVQALRDTLTGDQLPQWAANGRRHVVENFSHERFLENHLSVYSRVVRGEFDIKGPLQDHHA
ncbi:MAG: glycosyltransferase [Gammaproteobacteria bacterium]|nr:glycosyltransferase [Gammaproteobacteria bacterium]MDJ0889641.1 glycosyltransferase [Gammaproteobacteria bacterium]